MYVCIKENATWVKRIKIMKPDESGSTKKPRKEHHREKEAERRGLRKRLRKSEDAKN